MPGDALTVARRLADEVAREERDVRAEQGRHEVQDGRGEEPPEQRRVREVRCVHGLRALPRRERLEGPFEVGGQGCELACRENGASEDEVALASVVRDLILIHD